MRAIVRAIETVTRAGGYLAAGLVLVLMGLMVFEAVARYVFAAPTMWSYDLSTMALGTIFVLSIAYTLASDAHVRIDLLHGLGPRIRPVVDLVGFGCVLLPLTIWLGWRLFGHFWRALETAERTGASAWNPLIWPFRAVMFVGVVLLVLQLVAEVLKAIRALRSPPPAPDRPEPRDTNQSRSGA